MKLILILGTSLSAAGLAVGFALFANQAISRESDHIDTPPPILPSRVAPDLSVDILRHTSIARHAAVSTGPVSKPLTSLPTAGNGTLTPHQTTQAAVVSRAMPMPLFDPALAERPPSRPVALAPAMPVTPVADDVSQDRTAMAPISAERFENLALIGVYR